MDRETWADLKDTQEGKPATEAEEQGVLRTDGGAGWLGVSCLHAPQPCNEPRCLSRGDRASTAVRTTAEQSAALGCAGEAHG